MNWLHFWESHAEHPNEAVQVGRISSGVPHSKEQLYAIVADIRAKTDLHSDDEVLDICCGNGALTALLAKHCLSVTGVDFSENLLQYARKHHSDVDLKFIHADARYLALNAQFDKIILYFSFQYFEKNKEADAVLKAVWNHLKPGAVALIGDVPNAKYRSAFYPTWKDQLRVLYHQLVGKNSMGKFWNPERLKAIAESIGFKSEILPQANHLPNAHYRFDLRLIKPNL